MKQQFNRLVCGVTVLGALALLAPTPAEAGPFWDWLTHKDKKPACGPQGCGAPAPGYAVCGPQGCGTYPAAAPVPYYTPPATRVGYAPIGYANYLPQVAPSGYVSYVPAYGNATQHPPHYVGYAPAYPTTANYAPAYAAQVTYAAPAAQPVVAGYAPTATYAAPANPGCPNCAGQVRNVPQPYYRSTTTQMPVTAYRPVMSYDPATGQPVVVMKPCTAYECQVQQVRTPFTYAAPAAAACTGPNCPQAGYPTTYATIPATPAPIATTPAPTTFTTPPGTTIIPGGARPANTFPSGSLAPTTDPANQAPSLGPDGLRSGASMIPVPQPGNTNNAAPAPLYSKPASLPAEEPKLKPVPDPEAPRSNAAPQLIDPRDKLTGNDFLQKYKVATVDYPDAVTLPAKPAPSDVRNIPTINRPSDDGWRAAK